ncbi:hypothetical protein HG530_003323 [Fusarium avenaceum]|nr:hypothetical protein HG530_003323 [Fusarium avenaceum]
MSTSSDSPRVHLEDVRLHRWIMQQSQRIISNIDKRVEELIIKAHPDSNSLHNLHVKLSTLLKEPKRILSESDKIARFLQPSIWMTWFILTANLKTLFQVRERLTHLLHVVNINELADLFAPRGRVASVCLWSSPDDLHLVLFGLLEEARG